MKNNFLGAGDSLFRKDSARSESFQNATSSEQANSQNSESNSQTSTAKTMRYDDEPTLNDNVLKEMADAYARVLSKYGYFMRQGDNAQGKTEIARETFQPFSPQQQIQPQQPFLQPQQPLLQPQPFQQQQRQPQQPFGTFETNLDYLSQNLLNAPPTVPSTNYIDNQTFASLQTTNNLLQQILNELKTISCLIENNRRRRLS
ncbi:MAG: hypothetical protein PHH71_02735 [Clostridia bacterium]|jgi:hypothetical protein|nr:hypothetical protein [Clostridia bacterium]MDD3232176.1 hypothetical protein [Clostridia bacterium]MDD3862710.1 hypothetical protein [Clostridia bacterium]MDD4408948.1 hypothetical protein [Clostridia bacterium]